MNTFPAALLATALLGLSLTTQADEASIKQNLQKNLPDANIQYVGKTPAKGIYEVVVEGNLLYTDESGNYLLAGNLIDAKTRTNLTEERLRKLYKVNVAALPLDLAIKTVRGDGSRKLYVFSDPDCPFCRKLEQELLGITNVTIYTFLFPLDIHPKGAEHAHLVWCSPNQSQAWIDLMTKNKVPAKVSKCSDPILKSVALGQQLRVNSTPTIILQNGERLTGALPRAELEKRMAEASKG